MRDLEGANRVLEEAADSQGEDSEGLRSEVKQLRAELEVGDVEMEP